METVDYWAIQASSFESGAFIEKSTDPEDGYTGTGPEYYFTRPMPELSTHATLYHSRPNTGPR